MSTEQDPLSDEAFRKWAQAFPGHPDRLDVWQECARRATEKRDADLESLHVYYRAENRRLRESLTRIVISLEILGEYEHLLEDARATLELQF